jgi:hypothetical protein
MAIEADQEPVDRPRRLFEARSIVGALVILGLVVFFGFGLQAIDDAVKAGSGFKQGQAYHVSSTLSFAPADGWEVDASATEKDLVTATKNGVKLKLSSLALPQGMTAGSFAHIFRASAAHDESYTTVTEPKDFGTASGDEGVTFVANGPTSVRETWIVTDGSTLAMLETSGSSSGWSSVQEELDAMAASIEISPGKSR